MPKGHSVDGVKLKSSRHSRIKCHNIGVNHAIGEPTRGRDDRHGAVAQAVKLRQAARLESRWHQHDVSATKHAVRKCLVVSNPQANFASVVTCKDAH